jgi:Protein of unknown function (DUF559)
MSSSIENARALRKRLTPQEVKIWTKLRELKKLGFHFRRQAPIGQYIMTLRHWAPELLSRSTAANTIAEVGLNWIDSAPRFFDRKASVFCGFGIRTSIKT